MRLPISAGIFPLNSFPPNNKRFKWDTLPISAGIFPLSLYSELLELENLCDKLNIKIEESPASQKDEKKQVNEGDKEHPLFMKTLETFEGEVLR